MSQFIVHVHPPHGVPTRAVSSLRGIFELAKAQPASDVIVYHDSGAGLLVALAARVHPRLHAVWRPSSKSGHAWRRVNSTLNSAIVVSSSRLLDVRGISQRAVLTKSSVVDSENVRDDSRLVEAHASLEARLLGRAPRIVRVARSVTFETIQLTQLVEQRRLGADIGLCSDVGPLVEPLRDAGFPVSTVEVGRRPGPLELALFAIRLRLRCRGRNLLLHSHNGPQILAVRLGRLMGSRARVFETHHNMHDLMASSKGSALSRFALRVTRRIPVHAAFISDAYRIDALREKLVVANRSSVIGTGIDVTDLVDRQRAAPDAVAIRQQLGVSMASSVIACIARLDPQKGHDLLLEAMSEVVDRDPASRLLLIGDGPRRGELEEAVRAKGLEENVLFLGHRHDVVELLTACDAVVLTSENEGFGRCVVEGLASGLPVVATSSRGPELILSGVTSSRLVPREALAIAEALVDRLAHPLTDEEKEEARARAMTFDELPIARAVLDLYDAA